MAAQLAGVPYGPLPTAAKAAAALAQPPRLVVIHDTSNSATAAAEAQYAATRPLSGATSAHFYVDGTGPLGSVPLNVQAWAAYSYANSHGWHIEMCGYNAGMTGAVPARTIAITAGLVRQLCELGGIPMVKLSPADVAAGKRGICGHWDITTGLNVGTHDDPGPKFDWTAFIAAVNGDDMPLTDADVQKIWTWDLQDGTPVEQAYKMLKRAADAASLLLTRFPADLTARLDAILAAALDDGDTTVVLPPDAIAALGELKALVKAVPSETADLVHADLAD